MSLSLDLSSHPCPLFLLMCGRREYLWRWWKTPTQWKSLKTFHFVSLKCLLLKQPFALSTFLFSMWPHSYCCGSLLDLSSEKPHQLYQTIWALWFWLCFLLSMPSSWYKYNLSFCEPHFFHYPFKKATAFAEDTFRTPEQLGPLQISAFIIVIQAMKTAKEWHWQSIYWAILSWPVWFQPPWYFLAKLTR